MLGWCENVVLEIEIWNLGSQATSILNSRDWEWNFCSKWSRCHLGKNIFDPK